MSKNLLLAACAATLVGAITASCGTNNPCVDKNIRCESPLVCDPGDAICKCGGRGGVVCPDGFTCDPTANVCQSTRCSKVDCTSQPGTSCDVLDGTCKCGGTGGQACTDAQTCNPNAKACVPRTNCSQLACPRNMTCDPASGACLCGGAACTAGQACAVGANDAKSCVADACNGVTCTGNNVCDPESGLCKCGVGAAAALCQLGQSCACPAGSDGGACQPSERSCQAAGPCQAGACGNGTTCDPVDGQCKCGGPGGPVCASNQICALGPPPQCQGGQQCTQPDGGPKVCNGGTSCDPEDGRCKCGGRGGIVCAPAGGLDGGTGDPAEICIQNPVQQACRRPCDIRNPDCADPTLCYYDSSATTPAAYCAVNTDTRTEESACTTPTACFSTTPTRRPLHCNGLVLGQTGICRAYCDVATGTAGCIQVPRPQNCVQINGAPVGYGFCQPL